jgi:hypothetical protein
MIRRYEAQITKPRTPYSMHDWVTVSVGRFSTAARAQAHLAKVLSKHPSEGTRQLPPSSHRTWSGDVYDVKRGQRVPRSGVEAPELLRPSFSEEMEYGWGGLGSSYEPASYTPVRARRRRPRMARTR